LGTRGVAPMTGPGLHPPTDARWGRISRFRDTYSAKTPTKAPKASQRRSWFTRKRRAD
jgi:hypothetical protein